MVVSCIVSLTVLEKKSVCTLHPAWAPHCAGHSRDLGSRQRSAYQLIPEFRGARAQWNFTDHLATSTVSRQFQGPRHLSTIIVIYRLYNADPPLAKLWVKSSGVGEVIFKEHIGQFNSFRDIRDHLPCVVQ